MDLFENEFVVSKIAAAVFLPKGKGTPIHKDRPTHGLVFNVDCSATYKFDTGEVLTCHPGEIIYLPKGSNYTAKRHMVNDTETRGIYAINFLTLFEQNKNRPCIIKVKGKDKIISLYSRAANAWITKDDGFYEECMSAIYQIIKQLKMESTVYAPTEKSLSALKPAIDYINKNFTEEIIQIEHLAKLCGVSEAYLRRLFHRAFFVSPAIYVRNQRIEYAKELLLTGEYSVSEVAAFSGFNDISYFSREFKKATGVSPNAYK